MYFGDENHLCILGLFGTTVVALSWLSNELRVSFLFSLVYVMPSFDERSFFSCCSLFDYYLNTIIYVRFYTVEFPCVRCYVLNGRKKEL